MSQFAAKDYDSHGYDLYRPQYPENFYDMLNALIKPKSTSNSAAEILVDVGCGPGTATGQMLEFLNFNKFIGLDISSTMIEKAKSTYCTSLNKGKLEFDVASYDDLTSLFEKNSVDVVTAVEAAHWFEFPTFVRQAHEILKKDGMLAVWGYVNPIVLECIESDMLLEELQYDPKTLGPYWEQPGRSILRSGLAECHLTPDSFSNIQEKMITTKDIRNNNVSDDYSLLIKRKMSMGSFEKYLKTYSSYYSWKSKNPTSPDIVECYVDKILASMGGNASRNDEVTIAWNSFYKIGYKK